MAVRTIHEHVKEKTDLARIYASDGAFHTAARVARELADDLERHALNVDALLRSLSSVDEDGKAGA